MVRDEDMGKLRMAGAGAAIVGSAVSAELAWLHARELSAFGVICGGATPHCGWCVSAAGLAALAAGLLYAQWRAARPAPVAIRSDDA